MNAPLDHPNRVLIADDDHANRELLRRMLQQLTTAELHVANDGAAALEAYRDLKPQVSFLDINMPAMDGFAVLEQIRQADPEAFVVMVSGHSGADTVQKALKQGVGGYIVKPFSAQRIADTLARYVAKSGDGRLLRNE
jgi:CheY-like chemotaxis protein